jgi:integrase
MARAKITKGIVDKLPSNNWIWDTALSGFGCRRQKDAIVYYIRWQQDGRQKMHALGRHGPLTPEAARTKAKKALGELAAGRDPFPSALGETFGDLVPRFLDRQRPRLKPKNFTDVERYLRVHAMPLARLALAKITRREVAALLANVERDSGPAARNRLRASLSTFFAFVIAEGLVEHSPVKGTGMAHEASRDRVLEDSELASVWHAAGTGDYGDLIRLLMLTGARRQELGSLTWGEINFAARVINLPASRIKNKRPLQIPLSQMAFDILKARHISYIIRDPSYRANGNGGFVFGGGRIGFTTWADGKRGLDRRLPGIQPFRAHDLRRSVATGMARIGVSIPVIEKVLGHTSGTFAGIVATYQHHDFADEKRQALELWADHIGKLVAVPAPATSKALAPTAVVA